MKSDILITVDALDAEAFGRKVELIESLASGRVDSPPPVNPPTVPATPVPPFVLPVKPPPKVRTPWFGVGDGEGHPGAEVEVSVYGSCLHPVTGFHVTVGCANFKLDAISAELGDFLKEHTEGTDPFVQFNQVNGGIPESYFNYAVNVFSLSDETLGNPISIPHGTELFRVKYRVKQAAGTGLYELVCADEYFYTNQNARKVDITYTYDPQGYTAVDCLSGKFVIT